MTRHRTELIADWVDHWVRRGEALPATQRRRALRALAAASPLFGSWHRSERLSGPLYVLAVTCQSAGVLALALGVRPLLCEALVLVGEVTGAVLAARLWRAVVQALDLAAGRLTWHDQRQRRDVSSHSPSRPDRLARTSEKVQNSGCGDRGAVE